MCVVWIYLIINKNVLAKQGRWIKTASGLLRWLRYFTQVHLNRVVDEHLSLYWLYPRFTHLQLWTTLSVSVHYFRPKNISTNSIMTFEVPQRMFEFRSAVHVFFFLRGIVHCWMSVHRDMFGESVFHNFFNSETGIFPDHRPFPNFDFVTLWARIYVHCQRFIMVCLRPDMRHTHTHTI